MLYSHQTPLVLETSRRGKREIVKQLPVNEQIKAREVLLIGEDGERLGVMSLRQALQVAKEHNLDLVEVAPGTSPPVCRILDWGKFKYQQAKKEREAKKGHKVASIREIRLRPKINEHDLESKVNTIKKLVGEGDKVKVCVIFRGREIAHPEIGKSIMQKIASSLKGLTGIDRPLTVEDRSMSVIFLPLPTKPAKEVKKTVEEAIDAKAQVS